jgi:hypothetical protein
LYPAVKVVMFLDVMASDLGSSFGFFMVLEAFLHGLGHARDIPNGD